MRKILSFALILLMLCCMASCVFSTGEDPKPAPKPLTEPDSINIKIVVIDNEGGTTEFPLDTTASTLREAADEIHLLEGDETEYGLFIKTVNGITVNPDNEEWWCITKKGETVMTGVDITPIADGDIYEFTFKTGY